MSFLLDTHALVWWLAAPERLSWRATERIKDKASQLFVSAVSVYEIEYKRGRDRLLYRLPRDLPRVVPLLGFQWLNLEPADALEAARLETDHRDPWDRILAAKARLRRIPLITVDRDLTGVCAALEIETVW